ncbi:MAG: PLD nuclease N-terminal domain-containing protein [Phycisphaerae bacterium]
MTTLPCAFLSNIAGPDFLILGLLYFVVSIVAIVEILKSRADPMTKLLWVIVVWFIPWIGLILYYTIGRPSVKSPYS